VLVFARYLWLGVCRPTFRSCGFRALWHAVNGLCTGSSRSFTAIRKEAGLCCGSRLREGRSVCLCWAPSKPKGPTHAGAHQVRRDSMVWCQSNGSNVIPRRARHGLAGLRPHTSMVGSVWEFPKERNSTRLLRGEALSIDRNQHDHHAILP